MNYFAMNTTSNNKRSIHRVAVRLAIIAAASLVASPSHGQMLFQGPTGSGNGFKDTVGYAFTVRDNPLSAHRLGVYDIGGDGLESMNIVGLWLEGEHCSPLQFFHLGALRHWNRAFVGLI